MQDAPSREIRPAAVIEIGTNSSKLLIADVSAPSGTITPRAFRKETTRTGEGLSASGEITASALLRSVNAVSRFLKLTQQYDCKNVVGFSTYPLRKATNGAQTARRIEDETGLAVRILSGEEEARFAWISARHGLKRTARNTYIIDIGGGSTEFVHANHEGIVETRSLPLGALRLTEKYLSSDPVDPDEMKNLRKHINSEVAAVFAAPSRTGLKPAGIDMVASGGSVTTIRKMNDLSWDFTSVTSPKIRIGTVRRLEATCLALPLEKRKRLPGLPPDRADIFPAGLAVVLAFMEAAGKRVLTVNPAGVRLGVLLHLVRNNFEW